MKWLLCFLPILCHCKTQAVSPPREPLIEVTESCHEPGQPYKWWPQLKEPK